MEERYLCHPNGGVASVAAGSQDPFSLVSGGSSDATVFMWDLRLKNKKNFLKFSVPGVLDDLLEVCYDQPSRTAVVASESSVVFLDFRMPTEPLWTYSLPNEVALMSRRPLSVTADDGNASRNMFLVVDDCGAVYGLNWSRHGAALSSYSLWEQCVFQHPTPISSADEQPVQPVGSLENICCGIATTTTTTCATAATRRVLWSFSMSGDVCGYELSSSTPASASASSMGRSIIRTYHDTETRWASKLDPTAGKQQKLHNPPMPTCVCSRDNVIAMGRADGTYSIFEVVMGEGDGDGGDATASSLRMDEILYAPGHESNGLASVQWVGGQEAAQRLLLTVALSGELSVWNIGAFVQEGDEADDGELPPLTYASSIRPEDETARKTNSARSDVVVNCCDLAPSNGVRCLVGDSAGYVHVFDVA